MLKIPKKASVVLSLILAHLCLAVLVATAVWVPTVLDHLINLPDLIGDRESITRLGRVGVWVAAYLALTIALVADIMLIILLHRVRNGLVFTAASVGLIRGVSWCALAMGGVFALLTYYFTLAFFIAFVALFIGLCLRVVKNVIEEATAIKAENDYTV